MDATATTAKTLAEVASAFNVSSRTVSEWKVKGCPGLETRGRYDLDAIAAWRALQPKRPDQIEASDLQEELLRQDVRKRTAEADIKSHQRDRVVGNLIAEEQVNLFASLWFREAARQFRALPKKVSAGFAPSEQLEQFTEELSVKIETALKGIRTKAAVLAGQAVEQSDIEQTFNVSIDDATDYAIVLKINGEEVATC
ncbi:hypothetical protein [Planctomycetes bacterium TBK1r]|uniref:Phage DNA packaging protein Nu1 n=1 Tax=Stieleria magnilauensis TaxID=2527963 RepID=A0ABX5Y2K1_9BACT|nr:hypothetical protein TBK1r_62100 [Planctomycetes bacterium TBK1r]